MPPRTRTSRAVAPPSTSTNPVESSTSSPPRDPPASTSVAAAAATATDIGINVDININSEFSLETSYLQAYIDRHNLPLPGSSSLEQECHNVTTTAIKQLKSRLSSRMTQTPRIVKSSMKTTKGGYNQRRGKLSMARMYKEIYNRELSKRIMHLQYSRNDQQCGCVLLKARLAVSELTCFRLRTECAAAKIERDRFEMEVGRLKRREEIKNEGDTQTQWMWQELINEMTEDDKKKVKEEDLTA